MVWATPGETSWRRWLALPTLLLVLAGVVQATLALAVAPALAPGAGKLARAERAMVYALTPEEGPRFRLAGGAEVVQLLVHLELPVGGAVGAEVRFGISATLRGPDGDVLWARTVTQRARQTKEGELAEGWDYEAAFVVDGGVELSDAARVELALPDVPPGSALELRLDAETGVLQGGVVEAFTRPTGLVRAYRRHVVDPAERELRRLALAGSGERRLSETYLPWYALAAEQQEQGLTTGWERLAAEGRAGVDYRVRSIYVAPPRPQVMPAAPVPALTVGAGQPVVVQLAGPGTVWVEAWAADGVPAGPGAVRVRLREVPLREGVALDGFGDRSGAAGLGDRSAGAADGSGGTADGAGGAGAASGSGVAGAAAGGAGAASGSGGAGAAAGGAGAASGSGVVGAAAGGAGAAVGPGDRSGEIGFGDRLIRAGSKDRSIKPGSGDRSGGGKVGGDAAGPEDRFDELRVLAAQEVAVAPAGRAEISVPAGWWSLEVETDLPAAMVQIRGDAPERHAGAEEHAVHGVAGGEAVVPVDVRVLPMYALGPGTAALPIELGAGEEPEGRFVRVSARAWGRLAPVTVRYSFVDARGTEVGGGTQLVETTVAAPFERLRAGEVGPEEVRTPVVFPLGEAAVSEEVSVGLIAPSGAVRMLVSTDAPALVAVHGRLPPGELAGAWTWPYDQVDEGRLIRWRFAPRVRSRSFPRRAEDHGARAAAGQVRTIVAQVRAEEVGLDAASDGPWRAEQPRGTHARLRLLEEVPPGRRKAALAAWGAGSYTRLRAGATTTLDLTRGRPRPPRLRYQVTGAAIDIVGSAIEVGVDGERSRWSVASRAGTRTLGRGATSTVQWTGPSAVAVLANRPAVEGGGRLYEHRQVHQLGSGGLRVSLEKPSTEPVTMNVVVYWLEGAPSEATMLEIEVDGGAPPRLRGTPVSGVLMARRKIAVVPERRADAIFPDRRGENVVAIGRTGVVLGDDVAAGRHSVRVRHVSGPAVWVRFFRAGKAAARSGAWQWGERRPASAPRVTTMVEVADDDE